MRPWRNWRMTKNASSSRTIRPSGIPLRSALQEPRRLGADKTGHFVWACDWYGGNLAKIDTHTMKVTIVPLPHPDSEEPYQTAVDSSHNVWMNMMNADAVMKYDTTTSKWTEYHASHARHRNTLYFALGERWPAIEIDLAYTRTRKVAKMTFRTKEESAVVEGAGTAARTSTRPVADSGSGWGRSDSPQPALFSSL